jgi:hypothetical protein
LLVRSSGSGLPIHKITALKTKKGYPFVYLDFWDSPLVVELAEVTTVPILLRSHFMPEIE